MRGGLIDAAKISRTVSWLVTLSILVRGYASLSSQSLSCCRKPCEQLLRFRCGRRSRLRWHSRRGRTTPSSSAFGAYARRNDRRRGGVTRSSLSDDRLLGGLARDSLRTKRCLGRLTRVNLAVDSFARNPHRVRCLTQQRSDFKLTLVTELHLGANAGRLIRNLLELRYAQLSPCEAFAQLRFRELSASSAPLG